MVDESKPVVVTALEVAELAGVSYSTIYARYDAGEMPAPLREKPLLLWDRGAIEAWIREVTSDSVPSIRRPAGRRPKGA